MKKSLPVILLMVIISTSACAPLATATPTATSTTLPATPPPATQPAAAPETQIPTTAAPTAVEPAPLAKTYTNSDFGLSFQVPSDWFGPDEFVSDQTLRVSVGSDVVYPYGTDRTEQIYTVKDSYYVVVQYTKGNQNGFWQDTYQSLVNLQDGESVSDARSLTIRVRQLDLGRFEGIEYISTLSETAQTEPVYIRQVILFDDQSNLLSIMGTPNNVEVGDGSGWREAYQRVDEANLDFFYQILDSLVVE